MSSRFRTRAASMAAPACLLALGCASRAPDNTEGATVKIAPSANDGRSGAPLPRGPFDLRAAAIPPALAIDGRLDEWPTPGTTPVRRVFVAVDAKRLVLAVSAGDAAKDGVVIALSSHVPEVPEIGWSQRGGSTHPLDDERCRFEQISLPEANWKNGEEQPPEVIAACRALLQRHTDFVARYKESFVRRFRLTDQRVEALSADGRPSPLSGASHAASAGSIEVSLPLEAMPRLAEAPLEMVYLAAAERALPTGLVPPSYQHTEGWTELKLPAPVSFEPHGELRAQLVGLSPFGTDQVSYRPAEPNKIELVSSSSGSAAIGGKNAPDRPVVVEDTFDMFTKTDEIGELTFGIARGLGTNLAILRKGKLASMAGIPHPWHIKRREGELHVFAFANNGFTWAVGTYVPPRWIVLRVNPDGTNEEIADEGVDVIGQWNAWDGDPEPFHDPELSTFGMKGKRNKKPKTVTWRWSQADRKYVSTVSPANQAGTY
jgi:hypothetical protein